jgi:hypothetical protein
MGKDFVDKHSLGHFLGGLLSGLFTVPGHVLASFLLFNGVHLLMEMSENNVHPYFVHEEVIINHVGDVILFTLGWFVGYQFYREVPCKLKTVGTATFIAFTAADVLFEYVTNKKSAEGRVLFHWVLFVTFCIFGCYAVYVYAPKYTLVLIPAVLIFACFSFVRLCTKTAEDEVLRHPTPSPFLKIG